MTTESDMPTAGDFKRLEDKVDEIGKAILLLARIDERQIAASRELGIVWTRLETAEKTVAAEKARLDMWIQRGVGAWAVISALFAVALKFLH